MLAIRRKWALKSGSGTSAARPLHSARQTQAQQRVFLNVELGHSVSECIFRAFEHVHGITDLPRPIRQSVGASVGLLIAIP